MSEQLWTRRRHADLFEAEYALQLERIANLRREITASLPAPLGAVGVTTDRPQHRDRAADATATAPAPNATPEEDQDLPESGVPDSAPGRSAPHGRRPWRSAAAPNAPEIRLPPGPPRPSAAARRRRRRFVAVSRVSEAQPADGLPLPSAVGRRWRRRPVVAAAALAALAGGAWMLVAPHPPETPPTTVFRVPGPATGLAVSGGRVWVAGPSSGAVWVLDGASGRPVAPPLHPGGTPARVTLDGRYAWIADTQRAAVIRVQRDGRGSPRTVRAGPDVADVTVAAGAVWTASSADGTVRVLDARGTRRVLHVGTRPFALAADERRVVALDAAGALIRLGARSRRASGPPVELGGSPVDVALAGDRAWVADVRAGTVRSVTLADGKLGRPVDVGSAPIAVAADAAGIYVVCSGDRTLVQLDPAGTVRSRIQLEHAPRALALDPRHVWVAAGTHEVIRLDR